MSALTHPVGPEPEGVYWVRRVLVVAVIMALIVLVSVVVRALGGGGSAAGNSPVIVTSAPASASTTPSVSATPSTSKAPSASPVAVGPASPAASKPAASKPAPSKAAPSTAAKTAPATVANKATSSGPVTCAPDDVAVRIAGTGRVRIGQTTSLYVWLLLTGTQPCQVDFTTFEVKIYSGNDRIWSTQDCAAWLPKTPLALKPQVATRFAVNWPTQRSAAGCKLTGTLRPGTYVATAVLQGSPPNQQVMVLS